MERSSLEELRRQLDGLRHGDAIDDERFDALFPSHLRSLSERHWTPVAIALRAVQLLDATASMHVLDVGGGVGKFCMLGALATPGRFTGVEQRPALVDAGRTAMGALGITRAHLALGRLEGVPWNQFDALYLYNPFEENLAEPEERIDGTVDHSEERYNHDVRLVERALARAAPGTRVVVYQGFGGRMPQSYRLLADERHDERSLRLWMKDGPSREERRTLAWKKAS